MKKIIVFCILLFSVTIIYGQTGIESFSIPWPNEYRWKTYDKATGLELTENKDQSDGWADLILVPGVETRDNWTVMGSVTHYARVTADVNCRSIENKIFAEIKKESPSARLSVIEENEHWALFKIEAIVFAIGGKAESKLCYVMKGWGNVYKADVTVKEASLNDNFVSVWTKIFKSRFYLYW